MKPFLTSIVALSPLVLLLSCELENGEIADKSSESPYISESSVTPSAINIVVEQLQDSFFDALLIIDVDLNDHDGLEDISIVSFAILTPDNKEISSGTLSDDGITPDQTRGDGKYASAVNVTLSATTIGTYTVKFLAVDKSGLVSTTAYQPLRVFNADNHAPVVSNVEIPDTVRVPRAEDIGVNDTNFVKITIKVDDQEGLIDIVDTYFTSKRPDGTTAGTYRMHDDGSEKVHPVFGGYSALSGDANAGDGIYTVTIPITVDIIVPTFRDFIFQARDQSSVTSNAITKRVYIR